MSLVAQIARMGEECDVKVRVEGNENAFGNVTDSHVQDRTVIAARTYPNRNTEIESTVGDRMRDRPVFMVPKGPNQPQPPQPEDRLVYEGTEYSVKAHTPYETHVEFLGEPVIHEDQDG